MQEVFRRPASLPRDRSRTMIAAGVVVALLGLALWFAIWPRWRTFGPPGPGIYLIVSPTFAADNTLFARAGWKETYRSTDAGATWQLLPGLKLHSIAFSPAYAADRTLIFVGTTPTDAISTDGGATWTFLPDEIDGLGVLAVSGAPAAAIFAVGPPVTITASGLSSATLYRSDDDGQSWHALPSPTADITGPEITLSPTYATDRTVFLRADTIHRSNDNGLTWTDLDIHVDEEVGLVFSPDYARDQTIFAPGFDALWRSTDAGRTWDRVGPSLWGCSTNLQFVRKAPADQTVLVGTSAQYRGAEYAAIHGSRDGGETWEEKTLDEFPQGLFGDSGECLKALGIAPGFPADPRIVLATDHEIYLSRDAGATWEDYGQSIHFADFYLPSYFTHGGRVFGHGYGQLYAIDLPR